MNLTLHIVRKDLVRMRLWIACWVALLLVPIAIGARLLGQTAFTGPDWNLPDKLAMITGAQVLVGYLLTILLIQEDGVVGTRAFWLTRPISRGRLLAAKTIGVLAVIGFVPLAVSVPWWLWCGFTSGQMAGAGLEMLAVLLLVMLPAAVVAVLTDSFARALLWSVVFLAVVLFAMMFFAGLNAMTARDSDEQWIASLRSLVAFAVVAVELAAVVAVQFLVRRRGGWLAVAATLVVLTPFFAVWLPAEWFADEPVERHAERLANVTVRATGARAEPRPQRAEFGVPQAVWTRLAIDGVPSDLALKGIASYQRWSWTSGLRAERRDRFGATMAPSSIAGLLPSQPDPETKRWLAERRKAVRERSGGPSAVALLPPSIVARMRAEPPRFEARFWWKAQRPELRVEIPLEPARWRAGGGYGVGIDRIERDATQMVFALVHTEPVSLVSQLPGGRQRHEADSEQWFALVNRERGEFLLMFDARSRANTRTIVVNGVRIQWRVQTEQAPRVIRAGVWVPDPRWQGGLSLTLIAMREEAVFAREVTMERYPLEP